MPQVETTLKRIISKLAGEEFVARIRLWRELWGGEPELRLIPTICDSKAGFLDVGANEGVYSLYARRYCRHVYALEPHPELAQRLTGILGDSGTVIPVAASDHAGTERLNIPMRDEHDVHTRSSLEADANPGFPTREVDVRLARVADLDLPEIGVIKIDVEGHELQAVKGARPLLVASHPILIVECEERHHRGGVARLIGYLEGIGYEGYFLHRGRLRPAAEFDPDQLQRLEAAKDPNGQRSPDYVNNFLFVERGNPAQLARIRAALPPVQ